MKMKFTEPLLLSLKSVKHS